MEQSVTEWSGMIQWHYIGVAVLIMWMVATINLPFITIDPNIHYIHYIHYMKRKITSKLLYWTGKIFRTSNFDAQQITFIVLTTNIIF